MSIINDNRLRGKARDPEMDELISAYDIFADRLFSALGKQSYTQTLCIYGQNVKGGVPCDAAEKLVTNYRYKK
jgi:hypothetical protein